MYSIQIRLVKSAWKVINTIRKKLVPTQPHKIGPVYMSTIGRSLLPPKAIKKGQTNMIEKDPRTLDTHMNIKCSVTRYYLYKIGKHKLTVWLCSVFFSLNINNFAIIFLIPFLIQVFLICRRFRVKYK